MKWKLSLPAAQMVVYYFVKLTGLAPFAVKKNELHPPTLLDRLYSIFLIAVYFSATLMATVSLLGYRIPGERSPFLRVLSIFGGTAKFCISPSTTCLVLMIFLFNYEKILSVVNKLRVISDGLKSFGIEEDREKFFKSHLVITVTIHLICNAMNIISAVFMEPEWSTAIAFKYCFDSFFHLNTVLVFAQVLFYMKRYFTLINERLLYDAVRPARRFGSLPSRSQMFVVSENSRDHLDRSGIEDRQRVRKIELLHLELSELVGQVTDVFTIPIFARSLQACIEMLLHSVWLAQIFQGLGKLSSDSDKAVFAMRITSTLLKMVVVTVQIFLIAHASVNICEEGRATKAVLFKIWNDFKPRELEREFSMFTLQMEHKPVRVAVFGGLDLDYSYPYKILGVVMTYVIIAVQFGTP